jgi:hypothetical protein
MKGFLTNFMSAMIKWMIWKIGTKDNNLNSILAETFPEKVKLVQKVFEDAKGEVDKEKFFRERERDV